MTCFCLSECEIHLPSTEAAFEVTAMYVPAVLNQGAGCVHGHQRLVLSYWPKWLLSITRGIFISFLRESMSSAGFSLGLVTQQHWCPVRS